MKQLTSSECILEKKKEKKKLPSLLLLEHIWKIRLHKQLQLKCQSHLQWRQDSFQVLWFRNKSTEMNLTRCRYRGGSEIPRSIDALWFSKTFYCSYAIFIYKLINCDAVIYLYKLDIVQIKEMGFGRYDQRLTLEQETWALRLCCLQQENKKTYKACICIYGNVFYVWFFNLLKMANHIKKKQYCIYQDRNIDIHTLTYYSKIKTQILHG